MQEEALRAATDALQNALEQEDDLVARTLMEAWRHHETAELIKRVEERFIAPAFRFVADHRKPRVFSLLEPDRQEIVLGAFPDEVMEPCVRYLPPDDLARLLGRMESRSRGRTLLLLEPDERGKVLALLGYSESSIGRLMTPDFVALRPDWTIQEAFAHLRRTGMDSETLHTVFVTDERGFLLDDIRLRTLVLAPTDGTVRDAMDGFVRKLSAHDERATAVDEMSRYDLFVLPVVDDEGVLLGVVTADDVLDIQREEATEDFHKSAAVYPLPKGYRDTRAFHLFKARIPWLMVLIVVGLMTTTIIAAFEETLEAMLVLAAFIPILIGSGGNTGAQASTLMVRALATGDMRLGEWFRAMRKEFLVGTGLGLAMGIGVAALAYWVGGPLPAFIVGTAMFCVVLLANLTGMLLPFVLTVFKRDPAVSSTPLITTLVDVTGLIVYFLIATWAIATWGGDPATGPLA